MERRLRFGRSPTHSVVALALINLAFGPSCFFSSFTTKTSGAKAFADRLKDLAGKSGPPGSNLARSSGEVTYMRLAKLFPAAAQGTNPLLNPDQFIILTATGMSRAIAEESRPSSSLAQIALRKWAAPLCSDYISSSSGEGSLFSTTGILLTGESLPTDETERMVLAAMRNGWFSTQRIDSLEAKILLSGYFDALEQAKGNTAQAKKALCMMVILAPQFWVGDVGPAAPIRRIAFELGRTTPTFADLDAFVQKRLTIDQYIRKIQSDPQFKPNYLETIHSWHRDWWGLRPYLAAQYGFLDPRSMATAFGVSSAGYPWLNTYTRTANGTPVMATTSFYNYGIDFNQNCSLEKKQPFDPRVSLITYDQRNRTTKQWEVVGSYVLDDPQAMDQLKKAMSYMGPSFDVSKYINTDCVKMDKKFNPTGDGKAPDQSIYNWDTNGSYPLYYRCNGQASMPGGGFKASTVHDFDIGAMDRYPQSPRYAYYPSRPLRGGYFANDPKVPNKLIGTMLETFDPEDRRISRWAPSGLQDGVDAFETWYSGQPAVTCNALARYPISCAYRPEKGQAPSYGGYWKWYNYSGHTGWDYPNFVISAFHSHYSLSHPLLLNQFRCGKPNLAALPKATDTLFSPETDLQAYPHGFDLSQYKTQSLNEFYGNINTLAAYTLYASGVPEETDAVMRLRDDLSQEPYRLIDSILENGKRYGELFTADYTFGREELELYYRSQGVALPQYPKDYVRSAATSSERKIFRKIQRKAFAQVPLSWGRTTGNVPIQVSAYYGTSPTLAKNSETVPLPTSGVLTMPAFLGPVSQKMRTISSRIFERLLCGQPSMYQPQGAQKSLHRKYMVLPENAAASATAALHLDESKGCFNCHVGLDPLASALSANFLRNVQVDENRALAGDFDILTNDFTQSNRWLGARSGGEPGEGALLGESISGFEGAGRVIANSEYMTSCVFRRTFERVYGRAIQLSDIEASQAEQKRFNETQDYNQLIRDLVNLKMYSQED